LIRIRVLWEDENCPLAERYPSSQELQHCCAGRFM
jgi:hypothetical protein